MTLLLKLIKIDGWKYNINYSEFIIFFLSLRPAKAEILKRKRAKTALCPGFEKVFQGE